MRYIYWPPNSMSQPELTDKSEFSSIKINPALWCIKPKRRPCLTGLRPSGVTDTPLWVMDGCQSHWELSVQPQGEWFGTVIVCLIATKITLFSRSLDRLGMWASVSGLKRETPRDTAWKRSRWAAPDNGLWTLLSPVVSHLLQTALMERWFGWRLWHDPVIDHLTDTGSNAYRIRFHILKKEPHLQILRLQPPCLVWTNWVFNS